MRASQTLRHPMPQRRFLASLGLPFARILTEGAHENQTVPVEVSAKLMRRGAPTSVRAIAIDTDITAIDPSVYVVCVAYESAVSMLTLLSASVTDLSHLPSMLERGLPKVLWALEQIQ